MTTEDRASDHIRRSALKYLVAAGLGVLGYVAASAARIVFLGDSGADALLARYSLSLDSMIVETREGQRTALEAFQALDSLSNSLPSLDSLSRFQLEWLLGGATSTSAIALRFTRAHEEESFPLRAAPAGRLSHDLQVWVDSIQSGFAKESTAALDLWSSPARENRNLGRLVAAALDDERTMWRALAEWNDLPTGHPDRTTAWAEYRHSHERLHSALLAIITAPGPPLPTPVLRANMSYRESMAAMERAGRELDRVYETMAEIRTEVRDYSGWAASRQRAAVVALIASLGAIAYVAAWALKGPSRGTKTPGSLER